MLVVPAVACLVTAVSGDEQAPLFMRDIRPILAAKCFACHGPDESHREADLRLDVRASAVKAAAIVPGQPARSELVRRILSDDADERMPPSDFGKTLTDAEKNLLRRWIADGANYQRHWSFVPPRRPSLPAVNDAGWPRNEIDRFVLAELEEQRLRPSPAARRYTLIRRVTLDLTGLPPTPEEADAFVNDEDPQAYQKLVDRLLASQQYGEHWARQWLDLARYADTNGYEKDRPRSVWPYRDWVIRAINNDMPFDRFTIEQLAGDLLPEAHEEQRIATGFHRNTMLNEEGGIDPLEFRFYALVDRVATTGTVWMGLTTGCAQCHSHKYDPISHTDYYRLMALLNNADEPDLIVRDPAVSERRHQLQQRIADLAATLPDQFRSANSELEERFGDWLTTERSRAVAWTLLRPVTMQTNLPRLELLDDGSIFATGDITKRDVFTLSFRLDEVDGPIRALRLEVLPDDRLPARGPGRCYYEGRQGNFFLSDVTATAEGRHVAFGAASHSYGKISIGSGNANAGNVLDGDGSTGWSTSGREGEPHQLVLNLERPLEAQGQMEIQLVFERHFAASLGRFRVSATSSERTVKARQIPVEIEALLTRGSGELRDEEVTQLRRCFFSVAPELAAAHEQIDALRKQIPEFPTTLVLQERPADNPRPTFRHHRGEYLSPKETVRPAVPAFLPPLDPEAHADRLTLARWLVSNRNPLAGVLWPRARAHTWRLWQSGRLAIASATPRLAGGRVFHAHRRRWIRLVAKALASTDRPQRDVPTEFPSHSAIA